MPKTNIMRTKRFVIIYAVVAIVALLLLVLMAAPLVFGATTISTNISTDGNLTVTGNATISGNTTLGSDATDTITLTGKIAGDGIFFVKETAATISVQDSTTINVAGAALNITGAAGAPTNNIPLAGYNTGGAINVTGGTGGTTAGNGGAITIAGGTGTASNTSGGNVTIRGGAKGSGGTDGTITIGDSNTSTITIGYASGTTTLTGFTQHSAGTVSLPSISFVGDTDTGLFASAANTLQLVAGGYNPIQIGTSSSTLSNVTINGTTTAGNILAGNGTEGNPTYSFSGDPDTGMYNGGAANFLKFSTGGYTSLAIGTSSSTLTGVTITGSTSVTGAVIASAGTVGAPSIAFTGDSDTGFFASAANTLELVAGGKNQIMVGTGSASVVTLGTTTFSSLGSVSIPALAFSGDTNTGIIGAAVGDVLKLVAGGYAPFQIGTSSDVLNAVTITGSGTVTGNMQHGDGLVGAPSITFSADTDNGMFRSGANTVQLVAGGYNPIQLGTSSSTLSNVTINGTTTAGNILAGDGVEGNPGYSFSLDPDTGIFRSGSNGFRLVAGGKGSLLIGSSTNDLVGVTVSGSTSITGNLTGGTVATNGSTTLDIAGALTTIALCHGNADLDDEPIVDCSGAPSDIAEYYETTSSVEAGDVVVTTQNFITYKGVRLEGEGTVVTSKNETLSVLAKSSTPYQSNVIGIVSTAPYQLFGEDVKEASKHPMPIALAGRVPVKVTSENGAIRAGDWLTASSKPGYAMKATGAGYVVGIALANFDGQNGKILALVKPGYIGASQFQGGESSNIQTTSGAASLEKVEKLTVQKNATIQGRLIVKGNARFDGQITVGKDTAGNISIKAGQKTARVDFGTPYKKMPVITVTPLGSPDGYYWVSDVSEKGFTVNVSKAPSNDLGFNWIALGSSE